MRFENGQLREVWEFVWDLLRRRLFLVLTGNSCPPSSRQAHRIYYETHGSGPCRRVRARSGGNAMSWGSRSLLRPPYTVVAFGTAGTFARAARPRRSTPRCSRTISPRSWTTRRSTRRLVGQSMGGFTVLAFALLIPGGDGARSLRDARRCARRESSATGRRSRAARASAVSPRCVLGPTSPTRAPAKAFLFEQ